MVELEVAEKWITDTFLADPLISQEVGTQIYLYMAPQGLVRPYVLITFLQGEDVNTFGGRALSQPAYQIHAIGKHADIAVLRAVANQIDSLLQDSKVVTAGYYLRIQREAPGHVPEPNEGVEYARVGGQYRCWISPAS